MLSKFRSNYTLGALLSFALLTQSCSSTASNDPYFGRVLPPEGQVLHYITGSEPQSLDPQAMVGQPETRIAVALFDGLVEYDEKTIAPVPSLATHWDVNANGTVWTFHLRPSAKWTDGKLLTACDFVYSWRRGLSPELAANNASMLYYVKNGEPFNSMSAYVRDPSTGRFATTDDLERAGESGPVNFSGTEPMNFNRNGLNCDTQGSQAASLQSEATPQHPQENSSSTTEAKYLFVPSDEAARAKLLNGDPAKNKPGQPKLARFIEGKQFVSVTKENVGVRALDAYTFEVTLEAPTAFFVKMLTHQFFRSVPRQAIEKYGDTLWTKPGHIVTSGAFKLAEWIPYDGVAVERNTSFWDNVNTKLDRIIFLTVEEATTMMNLYKAGEADAIGTNYVPAPWRNQLKETKRDYIYGPYVTIEFLAIKTTMPPLNDLRVRRALSMAINRQILADRSPGQLPLTGFTPPMEGYEGVKGTDFNPQEARRLLAEAGFPNGRGFPKIEILYNTLESNKQLYEIVQQMLKTNLNIPVELTNQEFRVYLDNTRNDRLNFKGLARRGWVGDYLDPNTFFELMTSGSTNNGTGWSDPKYDRMLMEANAAVDPSVRAAKLREVESYMIAQQPVIPLFVKAIAVMRKPYVKNFESNLLDQHNWRGVYINHNWRAD
ncbi:MAG: peptide ABC transporter substrate-binding protein [Pyrinomonadaceae bacterium]|nr:peptide ABC transporter substrate-binding protein [Pyrinomonadaceae bacterium]